MKNLLILFCFLFIACSDKEEIIESKIAVLCDFSKSDTIFTLTNAKYKIERGQFYDLRSSQWQLLALDSKKATKDTLRSKAKFINTKYADFKVNPLWFPESLNVCGNDPAGLIDGTVVRVSGIMYLNGTFPKSKSSKKSQINSPNASLAGYDNYFILTSIKKVDN